MIVRVAGCPAVVAQWQSTGGSSQRCPGFDSRRLPAFFTFLYFRLITSNFLYFQLEARYSQHIPHSPIHSHSRVRESGNEAMHVQKPGGGKVLRTQLLLGTGLWEVKLHNLLNSAWLYHDVTSISEHVVPQEICMAGYFLCERVGIYGMYFVSKFNGLNSMQKTEITESVTDPRSVY